MTHIAFVASGYPSAWHPYNGMFLKEIVRAIGRTGVLCSPIHPLPVHEWLRHVVLGRKSMRRREKHEALRPIFFSASNRFLGSYNTFHITQAMFQAAALRALHGLAQRPDAVYGHFLYSGGAAAVWCARKMGLPSFVAVGEGVFWTVRALGWERARKDFRDVTGIIAVSSLLKKKLLAELPLSDEQIAVFPNAADKTIFYPRPRAEMRAKFNLPTEQFIVAYVGNFLHEKGVARVAEAVDGLTGVGCVLAGSGPLNPSGRNILYCERTPHESIPELLSAADVFVLPTLIEGSCNALVEAMACGLPIITSDGEFNDDLVDETVSLRVDPLDVASIRQAVITLRDDRGRREKMAGAALLRSEQFDIKRRAEGICRFMAERIHARKAEARPGTQP